MTTVSDNFVRANGALGGNWSAVIAHNAENGPNTFAGNVLINNNGYGPINASGGDACALWTGATWGNNQSASATIKTVAAQTALLSITAASFSAGNTTYTYTVTSGSVTTPISGGFLYIVISGMTNSGNNGHFTATTFGTGTFTVANASGVTEAGSTGSGICPSDSGAGVMVRGSGSSAGTVNGYFWHVGTNSFGGGGRIAYYELWKVVNGVGTILAAANDAGKALIAPVPGDTLQLNVFGSNLYAYYNGVLFANVVDTAVTSGAPGITSWSINGTGEYQFAAWPTNSTATGNNGTTLNNFSATDSFTGFNVQQSVVGGAVSASLTQSVSMTNIAGNLLLAQIGFGSSGVFSTFADTLGNTWVPIDTIKTLGDGNSTGLFYVASCKGGANTITVTLTGTVAINFLAVTEYNPGTGNISSLDTFVFGTGSGTSYSVGPLTPAGVGELVASAVYIDSTTANFTKGTGYTLRYESPTAHTLSLQDILSATSGAQTSTATFNFAGFQGWLVAFKSTAQTQSVVLGNARMPTPITSTNQSGHALAISSPTLTTKTGQPIPVVFTDRNGNEYTVTGATVGAEVASPIPVVLCNSTGAPILPQFVLTSNGNKLTVSATLTGVKLGNPTPIYLTDPNGNAFGLSGFTLGALTQAPTPGVLSDVNGNLITITVAPT